MDASTFYPAHDAGTQDLVPPKKRRRGRNASTVDPAHDAGNNGLAALGAASLVAMDAATAKDVPFVTADGAAAILPDILAGIAAMQRGATLVTETPLAGYDPDGYGAQVRAAAKAKDITIMVVSPRSVDWLRREEGLEKDDVNDALLQLRLHVEGRSWPMRERRENGDELTDALGLALVASRRVGYTDGVGRDALALVRRSGAWDGKGNCPALYIKAAVAAWIVRSCGLGFRTYRFLVGNYERGRNQQVRASFYHDGMPTARAAARREGRDKPAKKDRKTVWAARTAAVKAIWKASTMNPAHDAGTGHLAP